MIKNINNLFYRMEPNDKELRILGSLIGSLSKKKKSIIDIYPLNLVNPCSNNDKKIKIKT